MYQGNLQAVEQLIERKRRLGHVREHPDFPGCPDMVLYFVTVLHTCQTALLCSLVVAGNTKTFVLIEDVR